MSELKATTAQEIVRNEKDCDYMDELFGGVKMPPTQVYLKSEADKVIAEKDKDIQRLENLCESYRIDCDNLAIREANACKEIERDNKQIRHSKHKRCLDNAWWCRKSNKAYAWSASNLRGWKIAVYYDKKAELYRKWHKRWRELAEKFKEEK